MFIYLFIIIVILFLKSSLPFCRFWGLTQLKTDTAKNAIKQFRKLSVISILGDERK